MDSDGKKLTLKQRYQENVEQYYERFVKPFDDEVEALEEKIRMLEENPAFAFNDKSIIAISRFGSIHRRLKEKLQSGLRSLLFAHAGGAVLTINILPSVVNNKPLINMVSVALDGFAWGLILLLIASILSFSSDWLANVQAVMSELGKRSYVFVKGWVTASLQISASVCVLVSFYLFVSVIISTANGVKELL
jgi:hypothetical protein